MLGMTAMGAYQVVARNFSSATENKIHSDDIARRLGFKGALVPGVAVFGHLTHPLVERFGGAWLSGGLANARFLKPAYHGDRLTVSMEEADGGFMVTCSNDAGELLATLRAQIPDEMPDPETPPTPAPQTLPERVEISWDNINEGEPLADWPLTLDAAGNRDHAERISDELALYRGDHAVVHPHWIQSLANGALTRRYIMPAWIHVGSEMRFRKLLRVGDDIIIRTVPLEKWRKKGHEFIRLYLAFERDGELTTEIFHTAIYRVAGS